VPTAEGEIDLSRWARCERCGGEPAPNGGISGGCLQVFKADCGVWSPSLAACPECVWGAYRVKAWRLKFYDQLEGVSSADLALLRKELRGDRSMLEAAGAVFPPTEFPVRMPASMQEDTRQRYSAARARLVKAAMAREEAERCASLG